MTTAGQRIGRTPTLDATPNAADAQEVRAFEDDDIEAVPPFPGEVPDSGPSPYEHAERWTSCDAAWYECLLLSGACMPLLLTSLFLPAQRLLWPWSLLGEGGLGFTLLAVVPFATIALAYVARSRLDVRLRAALQCALGATAAIGVSLASYGEEAALMGNPFLTAPTAFKLVGLGILIGAAAIAVANRLRKLDGSHLFLRTLSAAGGVVVLALMALPILDGRPLASVLLTAGAWQSEWAFNALILSVLAYAGCGIVAALGASPRPGLSFVMSVQARLTLLWIPFAFVNSMGSLAQGPAAFFAEVDTTALCLSAVKFSSILGGATLLMATGAAAYIAAGLRPESR